MSWSMGESGSAQSRWVSTSYTVLMMVSLGSMLHLRSLNYWVYLLGSLRMCIRNREVVVICGMLYPPSRKRARWWSMPYSFK